MNAMYNLLGAFADTLYTISYYINAAAADLNAKAVKLKMAIYAQDHPSGDRFESN